MKYSKIKNLKGWDKLLRELEEGRALRQEIKADFIKLKSLINEARENQEVENLAKLKESRGQLKQLQEEIKQLQTDKKAARQSFKDARLAGNIPGMQAALDQIIDLQDQINKKLTEVRHILEKAIKTVTTGP